LLFLLILLPLQPVHNLPSSALPQKELFSASTKGGTVEGVPEGGPCQERKMSTSSTGMKSKWVNAFKNIKGKQEAGKAAGAVPAGPPPILENSHVFQEYTYKKITPCDVCSQILRGSQRLIIINFIIVLSTPGHARQGLKCKLCRMNVHPDCQEKVGLMFQLKKPSAAGGQVRPQVQAAPAADICLRV
jgi:hypothetical protein